MWSTLATVAHLVTLVSAASSASSSASFLYPPKPSGTTQSLIINVVDTIVVQWKSNYKNPWLYLWCNNDIKKPKERFEWFKENVNSTGQLSFSPFFNADLDRTWDPKLPFNCDFELGPDNSDEPINGPPIAITSVKQTIATTYALTQTTNNRPPSSTPRPTTTRVSSAVPIAKVTVTATASPSIALLPTPLSPVDTGDDGGLSAGAIAGIAIGAILGVAALGVIGFLVWRNRRKVEKLEERMPMYIVTGGDEYAKPQGVDVADSAPPYRDEVYRHSYVAPKIGQVAGLSAGSAVEMQPERPISELHGSEVGGGSGNAAVGSR